ncbi:MAG: DNA polymerase domain-containing protein [Syntrophales bacterium]|nr:DNA polymerase domain-containing protein [Syntrophales bacterium]
MKTTGWLFDLYPLNDRMVLWFITDEGQRLRLEDEFPYVVYLGGPEARLRNLAQVWEKGRWARRVYFSRGRELWSGEEIPVLALELKSYAHLSRLRGWLGAQKEGLTGYNCDLDLAAYYFYRRKLWPCAWYDLEIKAGRLCRILPLEEQFAVEFSPPPLSIMTLGLTRDPLIPLTAGNGLVMSWEDQHLELEVQTAADLVRELGRVLERQDPDLVLSDWGDEEIIPPLWHWSCQHRVSLPLDREPGPVPRNFKNGRSYFSYGQIIYQGPSAPFFGRWHVDRRNSFFFREADLMGLMQIARLGQMSLQAAARTSPGTLITSMQLAKAVAGGILIPWRKGEPERFKSAAELLVIDKGGLTFMPPVGVHFQTGELDFASMYPTIMTIHNISPETVNCRCCGGEEELPVASGQWSVASSQRKSILTPAPWPPAPNMRFEKGGMGRGEPVPEANYRLCRRREGLVPRTLRPILVLREHLKARAREGGADAGVYKARQNALKWMLVTCFGYLGYKNARFGRIEAHEAVTAYGRDKLLTAKEICEAAGYLVLHGLTDCLWIKKPGLNAGELETLCQEVSKATGVKLALEGIYRWIVFLASRQDPQRPVATRYFGVFADGQLKVRGLICRRRDTPPFVRRAQEALLARLATTATPADLAALRPELEEMAAGFRQRLREGDLKPRDLVITRVLSQPVEEYRVDTATALAARQLKAAGIHLAPGEKVRYVQLERKGPKETRVQAAPFLETLERYDTEHYLELLDRAIDEVLLPFREVSSEQ